MSSRIKTVIAASAIAAATLGAAGVAVAGGSSGRSSGPDYTYGTPNPFADARAVVHVVETGQGKSHITLKVRGVEAAAGKTFGAHVHQAKCDAINPLLAGPHYEHVGATGLLEEREVWLDVTINKRGNGITHTTRPWSVDQSMPRSVIIHALPTAENGTAGARLACIDLDGN